MVAAVAIAHGDDTGEAERRGVRARELRLRALELADADVLAYRRVMDTLARRTEPGHGQRLREALSAAADPPLEIAGIAAEVARHAADSVAGARGGIRGEAITSAVLAEAVVRVARGVVEMNLGGQAGDPRLARVAALADSAAADLARATGARRSA
jgi:formiminotetrahydrofolate cyclodeaminase